MRTPIMNSFIPLLALATTAALVTGCASSGTKQAAKAAGSLQEASVGFHDVIPSFDAALLALSDLMNGTGAEMAPRFRTYNDAVRQLEAQVQAARVPSVAMQRESLDYIETWNKSRAGIQDGHARMLSLERTLVVGTQFEGARDSYAQSQADFGLFMADLKDIRTALAADLSPDGLDSIRGLAARAAANAVPLRASLQSLSEDFRSLGVALASSAPAS